MTRVAVVVVADLLEQRLGHALGDAAVDLALGEQRVEDAAGVVDGDEAHAARPRPVSVSTSTTATWAPNGNVAPTGLEVVIDRQRVAVVAAATPARPTCDRSAGVPATWKRPSALSSTTSSGLASSSVGGELAGLVDERRPRLVHGRAAELQRPRAHRALAAPARGRCRRGRLDVVHRDAELVADEHGERGGVALAVGRGAGVDDGAAVGLDLDLGVLLARRAARR